MSRRRAARGPDGLPPEGAPNGVDPRRLRGLRMESFAALAGGAAHELNNLLAAVVMSIGLLGGRRAAPAEQSVLSALEEAARRMMGISRQLQSLARGVECETMLFQPRFLITDVQALISSTAPGLLVVVTEYSNDLFPLRGDPLLVYQLLLALGLAARDAVGGRGTVTLAARNVVIGHEPLVEGASPGAHLLVEVTGKPPAGAPLAVAEPGEPAAPRQEPGWRSALAAAGGFAEPAPRHRGVGWRAYLPAAET
jgi:signal transduction histidine kinase